VIPLATVDALSMILGVFGLTAVAGAGFGIGLELGRAAWHSTPWGEDDE
jgi:hypothetical protein